ncbi:MAG: hypothetical protein GYB20_07695 [Oceanospirillales bacterium]|nr:hypothetical protein [Oceanospirillales bacterium]MBR9887564.1 hypothetical protein [Oceanospirillales bacterium]
MLNKKAMRMPKTIPLGILFSHEDNLLIYMDLVKKNSLWEYIGYQKKSQAAWTGAQSWFTAPQQRA